jgi:hypothetical protein
MHAPRPDVPAATPSPRLAAVPDTAPPYDGESRGEYQPDPLLPVAAPAVLLPDNSGAEAAWARQLAQAIIEAIAGTRPLRQVLPATTERVQAQIKRLTPLLRADGGARIRRILTSQTGAGVVEVTVIAGFGPRTRALAMRFEHVPARATAPGLPSRPARWLCTDVATP